MHGKSGNSAFAVSGQSASYIVKTAHDLTDTSCASLAIENIPSPSFVASATLADPSELSELEYRDEPETFTTTIPSVGTTLTSHTINNICTGISSLAIDDQTTFKGFSVSFELTNPSF